jgi:magnesium and cobalt transporter
LERSGPVRLRLWLEEAVGPLGRLRTQPARLEAYRLVLAACAKLLPVAFALACGLLYARLVLPAPILGATLTVLVLVFATELLNRILVTRKAAVMLRVLTPLYQVFLLLALPLVLVFAPAVPLVGGVPDPLGEAEEEEASDEEIEAFIDFGTREGILDSEEGDLVWGIVDFGDTQVKSVMTPRIDMAVASVETPTQELVAVFLSSGHSRLPLFEGSVDRIVGILHIRDLLRSLESHGRLPPTRLAKAPYFVPETKLLAELLKEMQARHQPLAIVVDEYGGTAGLVTVEDLLEEIVGEIIDEHEEEVPEVQPLPDGSVRLAGKVHVETLEELFDVEVGETPYETVGGLVFSIVGDVPQLGQVVEWLGLRFQVETLEDRRIGTVRVERIAPAAPPPGGASPEVADGR